MRRYAAALVTVLLLAGCGSKPTIDNTQLEKRIHTWAVDKESASPRAKVQCPAEIPIKAGSTFHCLVSAGNQTVRLVVTIENDNGDVTWTTG